MGMKQIFEKKNMNEKVESKETEKESRVKQLSNTFENMMDRGKRDKNDRVEKQREVDKRNRKNKREQNMKRKRVNSTEIVKFGVIRQEKYRTDGNMSEITESRVSSRVKGIEREVEKQRGGGTAEKKIKMSREEEEGGFVSLNPKVRRAHKN